MSMLPVWRVSKVKIYLNNSRQRVVALKIRCPRKDCGLAMYVSPTWADPLYHDKTLIVGRSCPYCMRTAQVPERFPGGRERG